MNDKIEPNEPIEIGNVRLYTTKGLAAAFGETEKGIKRSLKKAGIPTQKIGRKVFVNEKDILKHFKK